MNETTIFIGFMDLLALPLDRRQRLAALHALAREADRFTVEDVLLAAALLDCSSRSRVDGRSLTPEQAGDIVAGYVEELRANPDPEVIRILAEAYDIRQPPPVVN